MVLSRENFKAALDLPFLQNRVQPPNTLLHRDQSIVAILLAVKQQHLKATQI